MCIYGDVVCREWAFTAKRTNVLRSVLDETEHIQAECTLIYSVFMHIREECTLAESDLMCTWKVFICTQRGTDRRRGLRWQWTVCTNTVCVGQTSESVVACMNRAQQRAKKC